MHPKVGTPGSILDYPPIPFRYLDTEYVWYQTLLPTDKYLAMGIPSKDTLASWSELVLRSLHEELLGSFVYINSNYTNTYSNENILTLTFHLRHSPTLLVKINKYVYWPIYALE